MGPRACNFCVEMPISAPKPNCAPSVKYVEAFAYTAAESTRVRNASITSGSSASTASLCFELYLAMCSKASSKPSTVFTANFNDKNSVPKLSLLAFLRSEASYCPARAA